MWNRIWYQPISAARLEWLTRFTLLILAFDCTLLMAPKAALYGQADFNVTHFSWLTMLHPLPSPQLYLAIMIAVGILSLVAFATIRPAWAVATIAVLYTYGWMISLLDSYQHHYFLSLLLFCLAAAHCTRQRTGLATGCWPFQLLGTVVAVMYFYSAIAKAEQGWLSGTTPSQWLDQTWLAERLAQSPWLWMALGILIVVGELALSLAYAYVVYVGESPRLRNQWICWCGLLLAAALHIGIETVGLSIGWFSYYMLVLSSAFFTPRRLLANVRGWRFTGLVTGRRWWSVARFVTAATVLFVTVTLFSDVFFRYHFIRGQDLQARGKPQAALHALNTALQWERRATDRQRADAHHALGLAHRDLGHNEPSLQSLRLAVRLKPRDAKLQYHLGNQLRQLDRLPEAQAAYEAAIAVDHEFVESWHNLGVVQAQQGQWQRSIRTLRQAIRIDPQFAEAHLQLGKILLLQKKDHEAALTSLQQAARLAASSFEANLLLGGAFEMRNDYANAISQYQRALVLRPGHVEALYNLANVHRRRGEKSAAIRYYRQLLNGSPSHPLARRAAEMLWHLETRKTGS